MDEFRVIAAMTSIETVKLKRASRRRKLTRLTKKLEEMRARPLQDQNAGTLNKLKDDFSKDKNYTKLFKFVANSYWKFRRESPQINSPRSWKVVKRLMKLTRKLSIWQKKPKTDSTYTSNLGT